MDSAAVDRGMQWATLDFMREAGMVQVAVSRPVSVQRVPRTSPERAAVSTRSRTLRGLLTIGVFRERKIPWTRESSSASDGTQGWLVVHTVACMTSGEVSPHAMGVWLMGYSLLPGVEAVSAAMVKVWIEATTGAAAEVHQSTRSLVLTVCVPLPAGSDEFV